MGTGVLSVNTGFHNTAVGDISLTANTTGLNNTAVGEASLAANTTGGDNTAVGVESLAANTTGNANTAVGLSSLGNSTGTNNTAVGYEAGSALVSGTNNIIIGAGAGSSLSGAETLNIDIGNTGNLGDSGAIRIGTSNEQTSAFIQGISNSAVSGGSAVFVDPNTGQLGLQGSSERFKTDIASMHLDLADVLELRPVTFHYKSQRAGALQYGLIAEEVAKVFPDLVVRDNKGTIISVRYDELSSILLKEVQTQQAAMTDQEKQLNLQTTQIRELNEKFAALEKENRELQEAIQRVTGVVPAQKH